MVDLEGKRSWPDVNEVVESFESAWARDGSAEVAGFAPPTDHPDHLAILCELVRVDLELNWERGRPRRLEEYLARFPQLSADPELLHAMAFEEYRLRLQAGEDPTPDEYLERFGLESREWPSASSSPNRLSSLASEAWSAGGIGPRSRGTGKTRPDDLSSLPGSQRISWEDESLLRALDQTDPHAAESLAVAMASFPRVGSRFLGFELCGELGRGAFGRVYLARQGDLANRLVALKVSSKFAGESQALAQLQHTNVVPIYSVHQRGGLQAVCMPYLGATTLADTLTVLKDRATPPRTGMELLSTLNRGGDASKRQEALEPSSRSDEPTPENLSGVERPAISARPASPQVERLRSLSFVPAVLWLVERVADGLAHAHQRGILHRDLKPANILFADDGEPLLLDFNLSADTKIRFHAAAAMIGGTLPYMAPEQLEAFREGHPLLDPRGDVYALGVILHELLTGSRPFPDRRGDVDDLLPIMIEDRRKPIPASVGTSPSLSPAVTAIVTHALEPDPDRRYQTAEAFQEDLRRQLDHLPLKHATEPFGQERLAKWASRHPRLTSTTGVGILAATLLLLISSLFWIRHQNYQAIEAAESFQRLIEERRDVDALLADPDADRDQTREGMDVCRLVAERYHVLDDPGWQRRPLVASLSADAKGRLLGNLGDLLVRWARALTRKVEPPNGARGTEALASAGRCLDRAEDCYGPQSPPRQLWLARAELASKAGDRTGEAERLRQRASTARPETPRERLQGIIDRVEPGDRRTLLAFLDQASQRDPQDYSNWMTLALAYARVGQVESANQCYGVAISMAPRVHWPHFNRGLLALEAHDSSAALADFDRVVALRPDLASAWINRSLAKLGLGDVRGALADLDHCLAEDGAPTRAWFIRSKARARAGDQEGAARDVQEGMRRPPDDETGFVARGLTRLEADPPGALADFDAALRLKPNYLPALQDKANVLAEKLGRVEDAVKVLDLALAFYPSDVPAMAGRGVLLARLGRRDLALKDAEQALKLDDNAQNLYQVGGVFALTSRQVPADASRSLQLLSRAIRKDASWLAVVPVDRDLDPIRENPNFRDLMAALSLLGRAGTTP